MINPNHYEINGRPAVFVSARSRAAALLEKQGLQKIVADAFAELLEQHKLLREDPPQAVTVRLEMTAEESYRVTHNFGTFGLLTTVYDVNAPGADVWHSSGGGDKDTTIIGVPYAGTFDVVVVPA